MGPAKDRDVVLVDISVAQTEDIVGIRASYAPSDAEATGWRLDGRQSEEDAGDAIALVAFGDVEASRTTADRSGGPDSSM